MSRPDSPAASTARPNTDEISHLTGEEPAVCRFNQSNGSTMPNHYPATAILRGETVVSDNEANTNEVKGTPVNSINMFKADEYEEGAPGSQRDLTRFPRSDSDATDDCSPELENPGKSDSSGIDFLNDNRKGMTYSRRIALTLMDKSWYNPRSGNPNFDKEEKEKLEKGVSSMLARRMDSDDEDSFAEAEAAAESVVPSLQKAWAYFEHVTLPRHIVRPKEHKEKKNVFTRVIHKMNKGDKKMELAEPGENDFPTKLYSPIFTPLDQMGDFGLGVGLYFSTLRALTIITFIAGLINIPNLIYFSGADYSNNQISVKSLLKGSAICTVQEWMPCPTCSFDNFTDATDRYHNVTLDGSTFHFAKKNFCDGPTLFQGMVNYATLLFVILGIYILSHYQKKKEIAFDEDEQTAQDYSVQITNPPKDSIDPHEWRDFFKDNFTDLHVTTCTVAVDNDFLVKCLVERRERLRLIRLSLPVGTSMDLIHLAKVAADIEAARNLFSRTLALVLPGIPEHYGRLVVLNAKIQGLAQRSYPATNVFVTFETETAQRQVLKAFSVGVMSIWRNDATKLTDQRYLFRGNQVLSVREADEPSTVRWQDLNEKIKDKLKQLAMTTFVSLCAIALVAFIVTVCRRKSALFAAIAISVSNAIFPMFAKVLTNCEAHSSEGSKQTSLYLKIAAFRWVNTAIVITIITPFTSTLTNGSDYLLQGVYAIFFAELTTTNALQLLDVGGHLQKHFSAPRARTQEAMNLAMGGTVYELAERYTNMTKILFLALWFCPIFPGALFLCSFILLVNFSVDRFSIMRTWKPAPKLGTSISRFSRTYFFTTAVLAMAIIGNYSWAGFPYDNLCENADGAGNAYSGTWNITLGDTTNTELTPNFSTTNLSYRYCSQNMMRFKNPKAFPALPSFQPDGGQWMTDDQEIITAIYGWTTVAILIAICLFFLFRIVKGFVNLFRGRYKPSGNVQGIPFSKVTSRSTYIPQVKSDVFSYPLIACSVKGIDNELFEWEDPDKPYQYYDLTHDAEALLKGNLVTEGATAHVFSKLVHWPPPDHVCKEE